MQRKPLFLLLALGGAMALAVSAQTLIAGNRTDARTALAQGLAALEKGDPRTARVELMNAIRADPSWSAAHVAQARVLLALGDGAGAQAELDRARALGADAARTRHLMAHAWLLQGQPRQALAEAEARDIIPEQAAYAARIAGQAHQALGDMVAADASFARALAIAPKDAATWTTLGQFRIAIGDRAGALVASDRAIALAPKSADALTLRAVLMRDQYGLAASVPWFDQALAADPNHLSALTEYAATLADLGMAQRMLSLTRRIIALDPHNPRAFFMQAVMAARAGRHDLARRLLAKTGGALDGQPATLLLRGVLYIDGGNATLAAGQLGQLVSQQPFNMQARLLYARALHDAGQFAQAQAVLAPLVERPDADSYALLLGARVDEALGDPIAAQALLARATRPGRGAPSVFATDAEPIPADPAAAGTNIPYIRTLLAAGDGNGAVVRATLLRNANPGAPAAHVVLGDVLSAVGRPAEAARAYAAAANLQFSEGTALRLIAAWNRAGQPVQATQALALYLSQNPVNIPANQVATTAWMQAGDWRQATAALEAVRARGGNGDAWLMTDLAWAWLGRGDARKALVYAAHAYRLQPASPVTTDAYGWALLQAQGGNRASVDLFEKAVILAPGNPLLQGHLRQARAALARKAAA